MISRRKIAAEYRLAHWAGIMQGRSASGLSISAYCESKGIHKNVYFYWQRKLREAACEKLLPEKQTQQNLTPPVGWSVAEAPIPEEKSVGFISIESKR